MNDDTDPTVDLRLAKVRSRLQRFVGSPRPRRIALTVFIVLTVFGLLGFFAAPPIIKSQLQTRLTTLLDRPVSLGEAHFNRFTLRLQLDLVHIADRDRHAPFIDVDRVVVNASWPRCSAWRRCWTKSRCSIRSCTSLARHHNNSTFLT